MADIEKKMEDYSRGTNILGLITFSMLFGWAVHSLGPDAAVLADLFHAVRRVCVYLVSVIIWFVVFRMRTSLSALSASGLKKPCPAPRDPCSIRIIEVPA